MPHFQELATILLLVLHSVDITYSFAFPKTTVENPILGFHKTCPAGYELHLERKTNKFECRCKKYHLYWPQDGLCYREFQQGPCPDGHR